MTFIFAMLLLIAPQSAEAYIDPGGISFAVQALLAAIFGGALALRLYWQKFRTYVSRLFSEKDKTADSASETVPAESSKKP
jgi:hypothetical protein